MSYGYNKKRGKKAAGERKKENARLRNLYGEAFIHMTPLKKVGFLYKKVQENVNA